MASEIVRVDGPTEEIRRISLAMKGAPPSFRRELPRALAGGAKVIRDAARSKAMTMRLPHRGGFDRAYRSSIRSAVVTKATRLSTNPTVQVGYVGKSRAANKARDVARSLDQGFIRHPVFGNRGEWAQTETPTEGWFTETARERTDEAIGEMSKRMEGLAQRLQWGRETGTYL